MGSKKRAVDNGTERARSIVTDLAGELRRAREQHGLSQAVVGRAAGVSASQVSRIERAQSKRLSIHHIARLLAVVGLELSARAYPAGPPVRDAAHQALRGRLRSRVAPTIAWRFEVPVERAGDRRAWDAVLVIGTVRFGVEAETRPRDVQALQRRVALKRRDAPDISGVVLLLANTRYNRQLLREHGDSLRADFPIDGPNLLAALAAGHDPRGSGVVLA
ncbi:MAG: helix-turn-helix transcriptional regulator [Candidatus Limnocylindrales bacterium]|jgi:transcriptional regulator with XRE-family HTH domain